MSGWRDARSPQEASREFARQWKEAIEKEGREERFYSAESFLWDALLLAQVVRKLKRGKTEIDDFIDWICGAGLERNLAASKIARSEYRRFLLSMPQIPTEEAVQCMIWFYTGLKNFLEDKGVALG